LITYDKVNKTGKIGRAWRYQRG